MESRLESDKRKAYDLLEQIMPRTGQSFRIGISGAPGVGKSTFIEALGMHLIGLGKRVAVLAIDPSSPRAGGSILADKTRMEALSRESDAYIRPSPARESLGGVAHKTREAMLLCEAAGYNVILVETVGVGQSEFEVASMVDFFAVLVLPNSGDELQGIKRGIVEMADAIVINKADGPLRDAAERAQAQFHSALRILTQTGSWRPRAMTCSALHGDNMDVFWQMAEEFRSKAVTSSEFASKRSQQSMDWWRKLLRDLLAERLLDIPHVRETIPRLEQQVRAGEISPFAAVTELADLL